MSPNSIDAGPYEGIVICSQNLEARRFRFLAPIFRSVSETGRPGTNGTVAMYAVA